MSKTVSLMRALVSVLVVVGGHHYASSQVKDVRTPSAQPSVQMPPDLERVLTDYEDAWRSRNAAVLARLFAEDGFVLPNGSLPIRGRAEIERFYAGAGGPLSLRAIAFAAEGEVGYIIGGYAGKKGEPDTGKFTLTLRKGTDGKWLIVSDMDSANRQR
jgi:ketosteroid isomerase-like protein